MVENEPAPETDGALFPRSVGERLRAAREAAGLDLNDIATKTRVPTRHLEAIERGDYAALPSSTYALGFTRSFARSVGLDETEIARDVRADLGRAPPEEVDSAPYQPADPARLPSRLLAWTAAILALVLVGGYLMWRAQYYGTGEATPTETTGPAASETVAPDASVPTAAGATTSPQITGQVVLTATAPVWLRIYDRTDKVILQKEMAAGETFSIPADVDTPMVRTGRPEALKVTVDGREVAPLGVAERTVRDVVLTAAALAARPVPAATPLPPVASPATTPPVTATP